MVIGVLLTTMLLVGTNGCTVSEDGDVEVVPLPPTDLSAKIFSKDQIDLTWKDISTNENGFKIERKIGSGIFMEIGTTSKDVTTFSDSKVSLNTNYTYRVFSYNKAGNSSTYSNEAQVKTLNVPTLTTSPITPTTFAPQLGNVVLPGGANSGGTITSDGGYPITARGVIWGTQMNPTINSKTKTIDGVGVGAFRSILTSLAPDTKYFVRAYATNEAGTAYGNELSFTTPSDPPFIFNTVVSATGRIWMDRNLGAFRLPEKNIDPAARGDLYQWGRGSDGHQKRTSTITTTSSSADKPVDGYFIINSQPLSPNNPGDWRNPQNSNLWQGVNGINNPCPNGFRIPTKEEWIEEVESWPNKTLASAYSSKLKIVAGDYRQSENGLVNELLLLQSPIGVAYFWTSSIDGNYSSSMAITNNSTSFPTRIYSGNRARGHFVRCIKH